MTANETYRLTISFLHLCLNYFSPKEEKNTRYYVLLTFEEKKSDFRDLTAARLYGLQIPDKMGTSPAPPKYWIQVYRPVMSRDPDTQFQPNMGSRHIVER